MGEMQPALLPNLYLDESPVIQKQSKPSWLVSLTSSNWLHFLLLVTHVKIYSILRSDIKKEFVYK